MKTNRLNLLLFILFPAYVLAGNRFQELYTNIHQFISQQKAEVGVAIIADGKDMIVYLNVSGKSDTMLMWLRDRALPW